jgi:hypothetical protein
MAKTKKRGKAPNPQKAFRRERDKIIREASEKALNQLYVLPLYILRCEFGFGPQRGKKFAEEFHRLHTAVATHQVKLETLYSEVQNGLNIDIDMDWSKGND